MAWTSPWFIHVVNNNKRLWASEQIIYILIRFNSCIENKVKPSLCLGFKYFIIKMFYPLF